MVKMTGQSRWDVNVRWTVMMDETAVNPYQQWDDLRKILAIFKAAPFVEVENGYLRQLLVAASGGNNSDHMAFALRQLRISTHPDIVDGFTCTLNMTLFNYHPFTSDFAYQVPPRPDNKTSSRAPGEPASRQPENSWFTLPDYWHRKPHRWVGKCPLPTVYNDFYEGRGQNRPPESGP